jgi:hypothetical protein
MIFIKTHFSRAKRYNTICLIPFALAIAFCSLKVILYSNISFKNTTIFWNQPLKHHLSHSVAVVDLPLLKYGRFSIQ